MEEEKPPEPQGPPEPEPGSEDWVYVDQPIEMVCTLLNLILFIIIMPVINATKPGVSIAMII